MPPIAADIQDPMLNFNCKRDASLFLELVDFYQRPIPLTLLSSSVGDGIQTLDHMSASVQIDHTPVRHSEVIFMPIPRYAMNIQQLTPADPTYLDGSVSAVVTSPGIFSPVIPQQTQIQRSHCKWGTFLSYFI